MLKLVRIRNMTVRIVKSVRDCGGSVRSVGKIWKKLRCLRKLLHRKIRN